MTKEPENGGNFPLSKSERDRIDLENERAGNVVGRPLRFLSPEARERVNPEKRRQAAERWARRLSALMHNPAYRAAYERVEGMLTRAETATAEALQDAEIEVAEGEAALTALQGRADRLPDGTRVYRDADGNAFAEGGRKLTAEEFESVVWHEGAPTWEAYKAKKEAHEKVLQDREAILRYQRDVLDTARDRLSDEDNPPSLEELRAIENEIEQDMPDQIRGRYQAAATANFTDPAGETSTERQLVDGETLGVSRPTVEFNRVVTANLDIPDLDLQPSDKVLSPGPGV